MLPEIVGEEVEEVVGARCRPGLGDVVDRLVPGRAEKEAPHPIGDRPIEAPVVGVDHPRGKVFAVRATGAEPLRPERHPRGHVPPRSGHRGRQRRHRRAVDAVDARRVILDADRRELRLGEAGGQSLELPLLPGCKRMIVALGTIEPCPEEHPRHPAGEFVGIDDAVSRRLSDEVHRRGVGPQTTGGDHLAHRLVPGTVGRDLIGKPRREAVAAKDDELAFLIPHQGRGQTAGERIGRPTVGKERRQCPIDRPRRGVGLEPADLLERRDRSAKRQPQPAEDREIVGSGRCFDPIGTSVFGEEPIDRRDGGIGRQGRPGRSVGHRRCGLRPTPDSQRIPGRRADEETEHDKRHGRKCLPGQLKSVESLVGHGTLPQPILSLIGHPRSRRSASQRE